MIFSSVLFYGVSCFIVVLLFLPHIFIVSQYCVPCFSDICAFCFYWACSYGPRVLFCFVCIFRCFSIELKALYISPHRGHLVSVFELRWLYGSCFAICLLVGAISLFSVWRVGCVHFHLSSVLLCVLCFPRMFPFLVGLFFTLLFFLSFSRDQSSALLGITLGLLCSPSVSSGLVCSCSGLPRMFSFSPSVLSWSCCSFSASSVLVAPRS